MSSTTSVVETSLFMASPHSHDGVQSARWSVAGKMRVEQFLEMAPGTDEHRGEHEIDHGGPQIDREVESLGENGFGLAHQVEDGDDACDRTSLHEENDFVAACGLSDAIGMGKDDNPVGLQPVHAHRLRRFDLA